MDNLFIIVLFVAFLRCNTCVIAIWARAATTRNSILCCKGGGVHPVTNGMEPRD